MRFLTFVCPAIVLAALAGIAGTPAAHAQLLGTQVTGSLQFGGVGPNFYDPGVGFVPNGYLNKTQGTTVTVATPAVEFGYADFVDTDTVNLTANTITLTNVSLGVSAPFVVKLTDTAFGGLAINKVSDTFPSGITFSLTGNTLTLNAPGFVSAGTHTAVFNAAPAVPEPGSVAMLAGMGLSGAGFLLRRRKQARQAA